ncbi:MAG TPA: class I adenylate-forming enzyme family protein [Acidimicrobiales bacterium]
MPAGPVTLRWSPEALPPQWRDALVGPGAPFELREEDVLGVPCAMFAQRPRSLRAVLQAAVERFGDLPYLAFPERTLTFAEVAGGAARVARLLGDDHGVGKGDRVAIAAANSLPYALAWWATACAGAIGVGLNGWWAGPELEHGIRLTAPKVVLADARRRERLAAGGIAVEAPLIDLADLVDLADLAGAEAPGGAAGGAADPPALPDVGIDEDDPVVILFTSGTTGRPKGALLSHRNVVHAGLAAGLGGAIGALGSTSLPPPGQAASICASPFFHVSGALPLVIGPFFGSKLVFAPPGPWDETTHLELTERHRVTAWSGVPAQIWRLLQHPDLGSYDLSSLRTVGGGGAMFPPELLRLVRECLPGVRMGTGYGMSETFGSGTRLGGAVADAHPGSVGTAEPGNEVQVREADGTPLGEGGVGEVCIRSASVFLGYWGDPAATAAALDDRRWYRTGDFGRIEGGVLHLESRMRDLIIRGGENVYPIEVENRLAEHPGIADACVVGVDHAVLGQEVVAVVVPRPGAALDADQVRAWVAGALAGFKVPAHVVFRERLPYTLTGKLLKHEVEAEVAARLAPG